MGSMTRVSVEPAWILHRYPYRDSSLLLEVFTREHGRTGLVARGARNSRCRWRGQLQLMSPLLLSWNLRGELGTLTAAETRGALAPIPGRCLLSASYLNELLLRLLNRHDPHPGLFDAYERAMVALPDSEEQVLRIFEKSLLQELGYGLQLDQEAGSGVPVEEQALYEYRLEQGPVRCDGSAGSGLLLRGTSLLALHRERPFDKQAGRELKALLRAALDLYLGARPLKTRTVLRELTALERTHGSRNVPGRLPDQQGDGHA